MSGISSISTMKKPSVCVKRRTAARRLPSTSTFTVPSGSRSSWMIVPIVPIVKMSSGIGSLVFALRCAERKISFPPAAPFPIASSSALIDFSRPTNSGTTMCGKTTMSRNGSSGTRRGPLLSSWRSDIRARILATLRALTPNNRLRSRFTSATAGQPGTSAQGSSAPRSSAGLEASPGVVVHVLGLLRLLHLHAESARHAARSPRPPRRPRASSPSPSAPARRRPCPSAPSLTSMNDQPPRPSATVQNIIAPTNTSGSQAARSPLPPNQKAGDSSVDRSRAWNPP